MKSNYRKDSSRLIFYVNDKPIHSCNLSTRHSLDGKSNFTLSQLTDVAELKQAMDSLATRLFGLYYAKWRNKYFPVDCSFIFNIVNPGFHELKIRIETDELNSSVRFDSFDFKYIKADIDSID